MALFPPARMGGENVDYGYKGKGSLMHLIVDAQGKPLYATLTGAKRFYRRIATRWERLSPVYEAFMLLGIAFFWFRN